MPKYTETTIEAKRLWVAANVELQQGQIRDYFNKAHELHQFMTQNDLKPDDLIPLLAKVQIVPQSFSRLQAIYETASIYSRIASTEQDSLIECGFVSAINKMSAFFMDCKLQPNERANPDSDFHLSRKDVACEIMEHIEHVANPDIVIGTMSLKDLMQQKVTALRRLDNDSEEALEKIYAYKGEKIQFQKPITSQINIANPNTGIANLQADWSRESMQKRLHINGIPLEQFAQKYGEFKTEKHVLKFFDEVILKDFKGSLEQKKEAVDYLRRAFHQGGLLYPVSAAVTTSLFEDSNGIAYGIPEVMSQKINIQTTAQGFRIQELCSFGDVLMADPNNVLQLNHLTNNLGVIKPHNEIGALINAEGTIDVNFSKTPQNPTITVQSNKIEINHPELAKHLDSRSLLQKFVDFIKHAFGQNKVEDLQVTPNSMKEQLMSLKEENTDHTSKPSMG